MVELDEATRRALLAREGPPASARAEILAGLRERLGGPQDPGDPEDPGDLGDLGGGESLPIGGESIAAAGQLAWVAKVVGATLGLTAAGLLTVKLGAVVLGSPDSKPEPARPAVVEAPDAVAIVESAPRRVSVPPEQPIFGSAPVVDPAVRKPEARPVAPSESTLAAELALVRAAKQLRADDPEAALAKLELHAERFPNGSLAPERDALRVEVLCALDRRAAASEARAEFFERHQDSPLRARVRASCGDVGMDPASAGD